MGLGRENEERRAREKGSGGKTKTAARPGARASFVLEGKAVFKLSRGVFYNPEMAFCRDISSLAVGAIGGRIAVCDGMCATGARGIRYALENSNVSSVVFVDAGARAVKLAKENARLNSLSRKSAGRKSPVPVKFHKGDLNDFLSSNSFDFIELDPFGSPEPFLHSALRSFRSMKNGFLSVTATDTAVLCGAHFKACVKNYGSRPLDNEFCHETAARILLSKIAREASPFNLGITPLFTLSKRHYLKLLVRLERGAEAATASAKSALGFVFHCPSCLSFSASREPLALSCSCGGKTSWAGPLWLGGLHEKKFIGRMQALNASRDCLGREQVSRLFSLFAGECDAPAFYYDIHRLAEKQGVSPPSMDSVIARLRAAGFRAERTHFSGTGVKTDAGVGGVLNSMR